MDYIENYTFDTQSGGSGGIPLQIYGTEYLGGGGGGNGNSGSIYFPGGLFVNSNYLLSGEICSTDFDHITKNIFEPYDQFLDLVSASSSSSASSSYRRNSKKKIIFKKPKNSYSKKRNVYEKR